MDVLQAVKTYTTKMVSNPSSIKVLLLDSHTTPIVSLASTQSELLTHQVYLTDRIDNTKRDRMQHLKCVCFLSTKEESLEAVREELRHPKYGEYYLYFSNVLSKSDIERLAEADSYELVREVQEYFADYCPLLPSLFSLNHLPSENEPLYGSSSSSWNPVALERSVQAISAVLLSLKKKPMIRYERTGAMGRKLGGEIQKFMQTNASLFDFRPTQTPPLLLILDRLNDPVTPLLSQWTYQAMVHEILDIHNGRVDLSNVPDIRPELREITLLPQSDPFFQSNLLSNFGDLGTSLKEYVDSYKSKSTNTTAIESLADMKRFVEEYPEFKRLGSNVSKHVALVGELSRVVGRDQLLEVSEIEQGLAGTGSGHAGDLKAVQGLLESPIPPANKLRLAILYALRYQKNSNNAIPQIMQALLRNGVSEEDTKLVYVLLNIAGAEQRQDDLFSGVENIFSRGRSALKGLQGVENVYTQHKPRLSQTLDLLIKGRLRDTNYPFVDGTSSGSGSSTPTQNQTAAPRPQDIIIFIVGGTTYEEARTVALLNQELAASAQFAGTRILLGGTCVHNSTSFLNQIRSALPLLPLLPPSVTQPPLPISSSNSPQPGINLNLGGIQVSVGGAGGTGVYRTSGEESRVGIQADGIKDGVRNLFGKVRQGVESVRLP